MNLGDLQQMVMLAVARLGGDAYGAAIREELHGVAGRRVAVQTVYVTLVRLEKQGLVTSEELARDPGEGGRARRVFRVTPAGWRALDAARRSMKQMWEGVERP
jgi:DNA-binding PadR family transcriptional regulator